MILPGTKLLARQLLRVWVTVVLVMVASLMAAWELAAPLSSGRLFAAFTLVFWIAPAVGLAWSGVLLYRARKAGGSMKAA